MQKHFLDLSVPPEQPPESSWTFAEELQKKIHPPIHWPQGRPNSHEADLRRGVRVRPEFPDPSGVLPAAYSDFHDFLRSVHISDQGVYPIVTGYKKTKIFEEYQVVVRKDRMEILAGDTEGIRRGLVQVEDTLLGRGGPFLTFGVTARHPVVRTRISRCFYGPINRPPKYRDELADDVNYYPDGYLNRLAHEGVNGLWLTITFRDTCPPSRIIPEYGRDSGKRLEKLRRTVAQCARYGIKIYPFCIEPVALPLDGPVLKAHPELKGHVLGTQAGFCISTETGRAYVEEASRSLFEAVPGLGGLIVITVGERFTHCYSSAVPESGLDVKPINCPRCSKRKPWEVLGEVLEIMGRGMRAVNPQAELITWPYGQIICWGPKLMAKAAGYIPRGVILQHNFETGGQVKQLGKYRPLWDYWLSWAGPSRVFKVCARAAVKNDNRVFAKLQIGCSHEVATAPFVPAPGLLYQKYRRMHQMGVSGAMQCWYFGNYPSLMTKAAGQLSFAPLPASEGGFLKEFARRDWGRAAGEMARAWKYFQDGYEQYPGTHIFGYYGPMHDGATWPLYLRPRHLPLSPTWRIDYPVSGDHINECITSAFTYEEVLKLCQDMSKKWQKGVAILQRLKSKFKDRKDCLQDIAVAEALGLQFRSGANILRFYRVRDQLAKTRGWADKMKRLKAMRTIVADELEIDRELLGLARKDRRLGFHSEAEGYKYYPAKITWRKKQLESLLKTEFPEVERMICAGQNVFGDYTGETPAGPVYECSLTGQGTILRKDPSHNKWDLFPMVRCTRWAMVDNSTSTKNVYGGFLRPVADKKTRNWPRLSWQAAWDRSSLYFRFLFNEKNHHGQHADPRNDCVELTVQPGRLTGRISFFVNRDGHARAVVDDGYIGRVKSGWRVKMMNTKKNRVVVLQVPFACLAISGLKTKPPPSRLRVNVAFNINPFKALRFNSWSEIHLAKPRLCWGYNHPADYGWMILKQTNNIT